MARPPCLSSSWRSTDLTRLLCPPRSPRRSLQPLRPKKTTQEIVIISLGMSHNSFSAARVCNYSGCRGDPDVSAGEFGEDVEGPSAVLGRGGQVGAHRGEVLGAGEGAQAPGHLLLDLHHADVALSLVVVEGNA